MKAKIVAAAIALALFPPSSVQAKESTVTVIAPEICGTAGALVHSVCGEIAYVGRLNAHGGFMLSVTLPPALAFPKMHYMVQITSNWDIKAPPVMCVYTAQPISPTVFAISGEGCLSGSEPSWPPFAMAYTITGE
jgi:hypothetical protein